jgi:hypothetical protein
MSKQKEKRMIGDSGYEVKQAFRINGKEILLAENMSAEDNLFYLVCQYTENGIICEYSQGEGSGDYLEALQEFTGRINKEAAALQAERDVLNLPADLFTAEHCFPHNYGESIDEKVIAIHASVFSPEYRRGDYQLVLVDGGNGSMANPSGHAVYCYHLNSGKHTRFERYDVLGEIRPEAMPDWAKDGLARVNAERDKPATEKEFAGKYEIIDRIEAGQKVFALGYCEKAAQPYGTWQGYKNSRSNFDYGHYFSDREAANADLHKRAGEEQKRLDTKKRNNEAR